MSIKRERRITAGWKGYTQALKKQGCDSKQRKCSISVGSKDARSGTSCAEELADSPRAGTPAHTDQRMLPAAGLRAVDLTASAPELLRLPGTLWRNVAIEGVRERYTVLDASDDMMV